MNKIFALFTVFIMLFSLTACGSDPNAAATEPTESVVEVTEETTDTAQASTEAELHDPSNIVTDWEVALNYLVEGNERYVTGNTITRDTEEEDRQTLSQGQHPFAVIVTCSDSRVEPALYFDQKLGSLFDVENAGNVGGEVTLGTIEYAVEHLETPLVVVVGHSSCGAVTGAFDGGEYPENLASIIDRISMSIEGSATLDDAIYANINSVVEEIKEDSIVEEMGAKVLGAYYDIETGVVTWLD